MKITTILKQKMGKVDKIANRQTVDGHATHADKQSYCVCWQTFNTWSEEPRCKHKSITI